MITKLYQEDASLQGRQDEIKIKIARIHILLEQEGLDGLLLMRHPNYSWITAGGKSFVANCFDKGEIAILITKTAQYAICSVIEEPRVIDEEQLPALGFELLVYGWEKSELERVVAGCCGRLAQVGSDFPCGGTLVIPEKINPLRYCLTDNELGRYRHLGDRMSATLEAYLSTIRPGMTEYELSGGISEALWKENIEQVMHLVSVDERAFRYRHGLPTGRRLKNLVIVSINGRYKGLITTTSRMVYFGKPPESLLRQYDDCCEMECRTVAKAKIGIDELELYNTLKQAYIDFGYPDMFARHGQGGCQGYWPRDYMITPYSHHIIQENQAYCFNPVVDGTKTEDSFVVTQEGPMFITVPVSYPKIVKEVDGIVMERPGMLVLD